MSIHGHHPFLPPESDRNPVRRLRGRLTSPVTLWTAASRGTDGTEGARAALPVSSMLVVDGSPGHVIGLVDPDSEFWALASEAGRFAVSVLTWSHRALADAFGELRPAPGGPFRMTTWESTEWGPIPEGVSTWAGCVVEDVRAIGWSYAVEAELAHIAIAESEEPPLLHHRGRYAKAGD